MCVLSNCKYKKLQSDILQEKRFLKAHSKIHNMFFDAYIEKHGDRHTIAVRLFIDKGLKIDVDSEHLNM